MGIKPDSVVAIMIERSIEMIVGMLAVLKAGGAYLPIDPDYPADRISYMLEDSGTKILLTRATLVDELFTDSLNNRIDVIDLAQSDIYSGEGLNLDNINKPSDLAYIIYTSGTTGKAKGVMIEHKNVVRLLFNDKFQFDFSEKVV